MDNKDIKNNNLDLMDSIDLEIIASLINQKVINIRDLANKLYKNGGVSGD